MDAAFDQPAVGAAPKFRPLKVDLHTHILPEHMPDWSKQFGYGWPDFVRLEHHCSCKAKMYKGDKFFREIEENCYRASARLRDCDRDEVDVQVLSTVPVMFSYFAKPQDGLAVSKFLNDHIASVCREHPGRFIGLGTVPMQAADLAVLELRRCITELGFAGIQIGSCVNDLSLSDSQLFPVYEEAERLGACIFVHPWDMAGTKAGCAPSSSKYWLPWLVEMPAATCSAICHMIFGGVLERFPKLRVCFAHGGGSFPATVGRIQHGFDVRPDLVAVDNAVPPRAYLGRFWVDSLVHDDDALLFVLKILGESRMILGSDYPFPLGEHHPGRLIENCSKLSDETKAMLLARNAVEFLGTHLFKPRAPPAGDAVVESKGVDSIPPQHIDVTATSDAKVVPGLVSTVASMPSN